MYFFFLKHFFRNPADVGGLLPLSKTVALEMTKELEARTPGRPWNILEVGSGPGNITGLIADKLQPGDRLDAIEIDSECCKLLKQRFDGDERIGIHCLSILDWRPSYTYDFIVSTLPLNSFNAGMVQKILEHYQALGKPNTRHTYVELAGFEYLNLCFAGKERVQEINSRRTVISGFQKNRLHDKRLIFCNFWPCHIYHLTL